MRKFLTLVIISILGGIAAPLIGSGCGTDATDDASAYLEKANISYSALECESYDSDDNGRVTCTAFNAVRLSDGGRQQEQLGEYLFECPSDYSCTAKNCRPVQGVYKRK